jgi:hypothetical protein
MGTGLFFKNKKFSSMKLHVRQKNRTVPNLNGSKAIPNFISIILIA